MITKIKKIRNCFSSNVCYHVPIKFKPEIPDPDPPSSEIPRSSPNNLIPKLN